MVSSIRPVGVSFQAQQSSGKNQVDHLRSATDKDVTAPQNPGGTHGSSTKSKIIKAVAVVALLVAAIFGAKRAGLTVDKVKNAVTPIINNVTSKVTSIFKRTPQVANEVAEAGAEAANAATGAVSESLSKVV